MTTPLPWAPNSYEDWVAEFDWEKTHTLDEINRAAFEAGQASRAPMVMQLQEQLSEAVRLLERAALQIKPGTQIRRDIAAFLNRLDANYPRGVFEEPRHISDSDITPRCGRDSLSPGYAACSREPGHDGPCAHRLDAKDRS